MMRRLRQRQRQQQSIWSMLETKQQKQSDISEVGDIITLKKVENQSLIGSLKIIEDLDDEINCCSALTGTLLKECV